jgi:hypothetical protein
MARQTKAQREREIMMLQAACDLVAQQQTSVWSAENPGIAAEAYAIKRALYDDRPPLVRARRFVHSAAARDILSLVISRVNRDLVKHDKKRDGVGAWIRSGSWYRNVCFAGEAIGIKVA